MTGLPPDFSRARYIDSCLDATEEAGSLALATNAAESALLRRRTRKGELASPRRGMYVRRPYWEALDPNQQALHLARTLARIHPGWVFSHATAALAHGMSVSYRISEPLHYVTTRRGGGTSSAGLVHHRRDNLRWGEASDLLVTDPASTLCDCASAYAFPDALAIADSALRLGLVRAEELPSLLEKGRGRRGAKGLRAVLDRCDPRAESGAESVARATLIERGFEVHDIQLVVGDLERPGRTHRLDIVLRRSDGGLVDLEVDGREKYEKLARQQGLSSVDAMMHERQREARVTAHGIPVVRVSAADVYNGALLERRLAAYGVFPVRRPA